MLARIRTLIETLRLRKKQLESGSRRHFDGSPPNPVETGFTATSTSESIFSLKTDRESSFLSKYQSFIIRVIILIAIAIVGYILYQLSTILINILVSAFLAILASPFLNALNRRKIPDWLGIIIIYAIVWVFIFLVLFAIIPIIAEQIIKLVGVISGALWNLNILLNTEGVAGLLRIPTWIDVWTPDWLDAWYLHTILPLFSGWDVARFSALLQENFSSISEFVTRNAQSVVSSGSSLFLGFTNILFQLVLIATFTFFIVLERKSIRSFFYDFLPLDLSYYLLRREKGILSALANWIQGQTILALSIFVLTYGLLHALRLFGIDVEKQFTLAFIAGAMEFIPYLGPIFAFVPALIIGLSLGFSDLVVLAITYWVIQLLENNLLVPMVMSKTLNLSPFAILLMMTLGGASFGILGIILAIPMTAVAYIFIADYLQWKDDLILEGHPLRDVPAHRAPHQHAPIDTSTAE